MSPNHSFQSRSLFLFAIALLGLVALLILRPLSLTSASSHTELDEYNEFLESGRVQEGSACARFNLELGKDALSGAGTIGRYELHEIGTGRILAAWQAEADWVDSGWLYDLDSTWQDGSWVEVVFYPTADTQNLDEILGVKLEILNPAADTDNYGWIKPGQCHAVELQFPETRVFDQPILGDPPIVLIAGSPPKEGATVPESAQPSVTASTNTSTSASTTSTTSQTSTSSTTSSSSGSGSTAAGSSNTNTTAATPTATPEATEITDTAAEAETTDETDTTAEETAESEEETTSEETASEEAATEAPETNTAEDEAQETIDTWLIYINQFRESAGLSPVTEDTSLTEGSVWHSSYMVRTDKPIAHSEDPNSDFYNPIGDAAAQAGNIFATTQVDGQYHWAINFWFSAPFHAVAMLDPRLQTVGYGDFSADDGQFKMAAVADVRTGVGPMPEGITYPIFFPGPDSQIWITRLSMDEWPSPYGNCPAYLRPTGPALLIRLGDGSVTPNVTKTAMLNSAGEHMEICVFDETNYRNPVEYEQNLGRTILDVNDTIVIIPRRALIVDDTYNVFIEVNDQIHEWSFDVVDPPELPEEEEE